jgi:hypothetical protein
MVGMNLTKVCHIHVWKFHNKTHVQIMYVDKMFLKIILKKSHMMKYLSTKLLYVYTL